jgi:NitT/TauT family transport system substrate-binding protein
MPHSRRYLLCAAGAAAATLALPRVVGAAAPPIVVGYTAVTDFASAFVASTEGYFRQRGIEVELKLVPVNSTIPAALQAGSLHIGGPTPSVFLQAVEGGLDLVGVSGGGVTSKNITTAGVAARAGSGIRRAADFVGKRVGVPGLNAFLHVTCRAWLKGEGVDYRQVQFVEAGFPLHADLLRGGSLDAVVTGEPYLSRIRDSGLGHVVAYHTTFLPDDRPTVLYAARRDWATQNAERVRAFRDAVREGAQFVRQPANDARVRDAIGRFVKLPPEVMATVPIVRSNAALRNDQLSYWVELMRDQGMLKSSPDIARLIVQ